MSLDRIKLCAIAAAIATSLTGEVSGQTTYPPSGTSPAQPSASRGSSQGSPTATTSPAPANPTTTTTPAPGMTGTGVSGGVPGMSGVTPNRAELAGSAFTKLDAGNRGYLTLEDVRQLEGFESAFRQADANGDGRLNPSEFNSAWGAYTGNVR
jgi:hypothetical protein